MSGPDEVMEQLSDIMKTVQTGTMVSEGVAAYDQFALGALRALLEKSVGGETPAWLAGRAWEIADAMFVERKRRFGRDES